MAELSRNYVHSNEEEVELKRSTKKVKENHPSTNVPSFEEGTFKDKLLGDIPGAYAQAFNIHNCTFEDVCADTDLDTKMKEISEGIISIKLSNSTISHIRGKWTHALEKEWVSIISTQKSWPSGSLREGLNVLILAGGFFLFASVLLRTMTMCLKEAHGSLEINSSPFNHGSQTLTLLQPIALLLQFGLGSQIYLLSIMIL